MNEECVVERLCVCVGGIKSACVLGYYECVIVWISVYLCVRENEIERNREIKGELESCVNSQESSRER